MIAQKSSADVAREPPRARVDDANGTTCSREKTFNANLCSENWWRYNKSSEDNEDRSDKNPLRRLEILGQLIPHKQNNHRKSVVVNIAITTKCVMQALEQNNFEQHKQPETKQSC